MLSLTTRTTTKSERRGKKKWWCDCREEKVENNDDAVDGQDEQENGEEEDTTEDPDVEEVEFKWKSIHSYPSYYIHCHNRSEYGPIGFILSYNNNIQS